MPTPPPDYSAVAAENLRRSLLGVAAQTAKKWIFPRKSRRPYVLGKMNLWSPESDDPKEVTEKHFPRRSARKHNREFRSKEDSQ